MIDQLKKVLFACWVLWIIVFCLATFTKFDFLEEAKNWFLMVIGTLHFLYLFFTKEGGLKWVFLACSLIFFGLFVFVMYGVFF